MKFGKGLFLGFLVMNGVNAQVNISPSSVSVDPLVVPQYVTINLTYPPGTTVNLNAASVLPKWLSLYSSTCDDATTGSCAYKYTIISSDLPKSSPSSVTLNCTVNVPGSGTTPCGSSVTINYTPILPVAISGDSSQSLNGATTKTSTISVAYSPSSSDPKSVTLYLDTANTPSLPNWLTLDKTSSCPSANSITLDQNSSCSLIFDIDPMKTPTDSVSYILNYCLSTNAAICTSTPVTFNFSPTYSISGNADGLLNGTSVKLNLTTTPSSSQNLPINDTITILQNGVFQFNDQIPPSSSYTIKVSSQPSGQTCYINNGSGTIQKENINDVKLNCSVNPFPLFSVGGTVSGLDSGQSVSLTLDQTGETQNVTGTGGPGPQNFTFKNPLPEGSAYEVSVTSQPSGMTCSVSPNGTGTSIQQQITNIQVTCSISQQTISGTLTGLATGQQVTLALSSSNTITLTSNKYFTFPNPIAYGSNYNVSVQTQPTAQNCTVTNGTGEATGNVTNVAINCADIPSLKPAPSNLVLSVTGRTEYGISPNGTTLKSGLPRTITITNTGGSQATNLQIIKPSNPSFPEGTDITANTCGNSLDVNKSCKITITPGGRSSSNDNNLHPCSTGTIPLPSNIQVSWEGANPISIPVTVLDYGCNFQGGYVFALDDSPSSLASIQGKVVSTEDKPASIWSANNLAYCGISDASTSSDPDPVGKVTCQSDGITYCNGATDGQCNSTVIEFFSSVITAVNQCQIEVNGFSDWYLPAICELMSFPTNTVPFCQTKNYQPITQDIYSNLVATNIGGTGNWSVSYWSSTETSNFWLDPSKGIWLAQFQTQTSFPIAAYPSARVEAKSSIRCVRKFSVAP